jgi:hypothetical protein
VHQYLTDSVLDSDTIVLVVHHTSQLATLSHALGYNKSYIVLDSRYVVMYQHIVFLLIQVAAIKLTNVSTFEQGDV